MTSAFARPTLRLTESQYATIIGNCYDGLPDEACGLLVGPFGGNGEPTGAVSEARPCRNVDASAVTYTVDPRDMLGAMRAAEARGDEIVGGQQHGGIAQGVAQVLWEEVQYDADANPVTASLIDYAMPSAAELPSYETYNTVTPTPLNPLGAKGIGESATLGSTPAVHNAVIDALSHLGVRHIDMPCTAERVWRALQG